MTARRIRGSLLALACWCGGVSAAPLEPPQIEEGTAFVRGAAAAALAGHAAAFGDSLDVDPTLARHLGAAAWAALTDWQKAELRTYVRDRFLRTLAVPRGVPVGIAWSSGRPSGDAGLSVDAGLALGDRTLKTRWTVSRRRGIWKVTDVRLSDPGVSLARAAAASLGPAPLRRQDSRRQARRVLLPRALGLAGIAIVVLAAGRRLSRPRRTLLYLTAGAPAILFAVDGALAARRAFSERYALVNEPPREPWRLAEDQADRAHRGGDLAAAQVHGERALALGAPAGPALYRSGRIARDRGLHGEARDLFRRALAEREPAPGAARELAAYMLGERLDREGRALLVRYVALTGPDPETLWLLAVAEANLGDVPASLDSIRAARALQGNEEDGAELEARVRARAADAAGAVEALRRLAPAGKLDRTALRADPDYVPIATDPVWVAFLAETPEGKPGTGNR